MTPNEDATLQEKLLKASQGVHLLDNQRLLDRTSRASERHLARQNRLLDQQYFGDGSAPTGGDEMPTSVLVLGNVQGDAAVQALQNISGNGKTQQVPAQQPAPVTQQSATSTPSTWSKVWPWLLAAGTLAAGAGGTAAVMAPAKPAATPVATQPSVPTAEIPKYDVQKWTPE